MLNSKPVTRTQCVYTVTTVFVRQYNDNINNNMNNFNF